ncbi:Na+/H+ antiporter [Chitinophaga rhizophila]|uniref:Na+/H+ antiporter n=1 Tax=Chitinophaga rhizophila TaxID=2866212 RepID=A0ABS7GGM7_9BACT|nr:Na+/H+ antiporter [Chitinophaga rhizophila]MBW8686842.1 Na+/H+ antiporter [Chitinophaga rhizophila]
MIHENLLLILSLLLVVFMLMMLGQRLKVSYPIFLVLGGLVIGFIPGVPRITMEPELVFLVFLPPLLFEAAWYTSWHNFWKWKRPIALLAFGLVLFTSGIVAYVSEAMIPGFTLAMGFLLGGIISPPDAVAATAVLKNVKLPKRAIYILEGESLVNDASSLIIFRFALVAIVSGTFSLHEATTQFFLVTVMGIVTGLAIGHVFYAILRWLPTTPSISTSFTFMAPYFMYLGAEYFHFSGVMAVVSGGLFLSFRSHEILNYNARMQAVSVWKTVAFILNGIVFILIGLELPEIIDGLGDYSLGEAIRYGIVISLLAIVIRVLWMYPATYIPRLLFKSVRTKENRPGWKGPLVIALAGMRGVVSLASALSIPLALDNGSSFPHRNLILFITFVVIFVTLVIQGLLLPVITRWLKLKEIDNIVPEVEQETGIRLHLMKVAHAQLQESYGKEIEENELVANLQHQLQSGIALSTTQLASLECDETEQHEIERYHSIRRHLIGLQRKELFRLKKEHLFDDEILRKQEGLLDLEEAEISGRSRH